MRVERPARRCRFTPAAGIVQATLKAVGARATAVRRLGGHFSAPACASFLAAAVPRQRSTRVQRESREKLLEVRRRARQTQASERAEKHPETALGPSAQPSLILFPPPEHGGGQGRGRLPAPAPFIDGETEALCNPKSVAGEAKSRAQKSLVVQPPAGCLPSATSSYLGGPVSPGRAVSRPDSSLGSARSPAHGPHTLSTRPILVLLIYILSSLQDPLCLETRNWLGVGWGEGPHFNLK